MTRRRFYAMPDNIADSMITLSADETHHLVHLLRMTPGNEAFVFDGCGHEYRCNFRKVEHNHARLEITEALSDIVESPLHLTLAQGLAKGEKFDFIVQKATELGVSTIAPLITRYSDVRFDEQQKKKRVERWRRISLEAMKQCGRRKLVDIALPRSLREFIAANASPDRSPFPASHDQRVLLLFTERDGESVTDALGERQESGSVIALIGPEGGWSEDEMEALNDYGCTAVTLGPRVLRTETAAVVAIALIQQAMGDLSAQRAQSQGRVS
ncbi:MAG TPA: 16S rRNA (uracil(1498)-N(3))-methyltransferase [Blastocatellia bacterium]|nr:16S rRNA (uracil(1498)-N(3))-methyltransferase [Blastocatellia bacterium]